MYTEIDKKLMLKFLERNYPITRLKHNTRFKRAIILDSGAVYFLSDSTSHKQLKFDLMNILKKIFGWDELITSAVLDCFLPVKNN